MGATPPPSLRTTAQVAATVREFARGYAACRQSPGYRLLFGVGTVFIVATLAQGILISTITRQQLLASQVAMIATFLPAFLLSGFAFRLESMPVALQVFSYAFPGREMVAISRGVFLKGAGFADLWPQLALLAGYAVVAVAAAVRLYGRSARR